MQAAAAPPPPDAPLESVDWPLEPTAPTLGREAGGATDVPMLRLSGPAPTLRGFRRLLEACAAVVGPARVHEAAQQGGQRLWPIFVLSRGRPETAHLHWGTEHALGGEGEGEGEGEGGGEGALVVAVVSPEEEAEYRRCWPGSLLLALPQAGRPVGYARHVLKRALQWRTPFFWMCDDNLSTFVRIERGSDGLARRHTQGSRCTTSCVSTPLGRDLSLTRHS
jgi:hypothetical protein